MLGAGRERALGSILLILMLFDLVVTRKAIPHHFLQILALVLYLVLQILVHFVDVLFNGRLVGFPMGISHHSISIVNILYHRHVASPLALVVTMSHFLILQRV